MSTLQEKILRFWGTVQIYPYPFFLIFGNPHYRIRGPEMRHILNIVQRGDILLRRYSHYLSSLSVPGWWSHGAVVKNKTTVVHATGEKGVHEEDILTFLRTDYISVLRYCGNNKAAVNRAVRTAEKALGTEYDFAFDSSEAEKFYCFELIAHCYDKVFEFSQSRGPVLARDIIDNADFETMFDSRIKKKEKDNEMVADAAEVAPEKVQSRNTDGEALQ